jgi:hypothetical protein
LTTAGLVRSSIGAKEGISPLSENQLSGSAADATWAIKTNAANQTMDDLKLNFTMPPDKNYSSDSRGLKAISSAICW